MNNYCMVFIRALRIRPNSTRQNNNKKLFKHTFRK